MDDARRFGGLTRLYGLEGAERIRNSHICVIGIGGVGSWTVEALARSGVGHISTVDLDVIAESNANRQIHAVEGNWGKAKVIAMAERIQTINPSCRVDCIDDFITPDNLADLLDPSITLIIDAIDQVRAKIALIAYCHRRGIPLVVTGAAGGQTDPTQIRQADLSQTTQDPLLAKVRAGLRKHHGFSRDPKKKFRIPCIYSLEPLRYPTQACGPDQTQGPAGLNCAGFGSVITVTASFGLAAAAAALNHLAAGQR